MPKVNKLYYGDNLDILRRYIKDESVDLIYLDPPFNSNQDYNVLFAEKNGSQSSAQISAFEDTWHWDHAAALSHAEVVERGGQPAQAMLAFRRLLGDNDMMAYLAMMAPRLIELQRVLKPSGSIYLHCDPTASHYLKVLMDSIFGSQFFKNEIVWKRTGAHGNVRGSLGDVTDTILFYVKSETNKWNQLFVPLREQLVKSKFRYKDSDGRRWQSVTLRNPGVRPNLHYPYTASNGVTYLPHPNGWSCKIERMRQYDKEGRLHFPSRPNGKLRLKMYLDESKGARLQNLWDDIPPINSQAQERLGYPTQKPEALLERIIRASSDPGDVVLDPFCGCGTAVVAAQKLERSWTGIDITHLAVSLIKYRLRDTFGTNLQFDVLGEPVSLHDARTLATQDPYQFQWWALGLVNARPMEQKKGADKGIDGRLYFHDEGPKGNTKQIVFSVKAGRIGSAHVRDLIGVITREKAQIGAMVTMHEPTRDMKREAASAGFYDSPWGKHPRIQLMTIKELLDGAQVDYPIHGDVTFKRAPKAKRTPKEGQLPLVAESQPDYDEPE